MLISLFEKFSLSIKTGLPSVRSVLIPLIWANLPPEFEVLKSLNPLYLRAAVSCYLVWK